MNVLTIDPPAFQIGDVVQYEVRAHRDGVELIGFRKCAVRGIELRQSGYDQQYFYTVVDSDAFWFYKNQQIVREDQLEMWVDDTPEEPVDPEEPIGEE